MIVNRVTGLMIDLVEVGLRFDGLTKRGVLVDRNAALIGVPAKVCGDQSLDLQNAYSRTAWG